MNLARFTVPRPVFTVMACLIVVSIGAISLHRLPIDLMPELTYPTLTVQTAYQNASPEEIEELITRPVEGTVAAVAGVETINSVSIEGNSTVRVSFTWGTDLDVAANDMRDRLDRITNVLPEEAERPRLFKFDAATYPVLILGVSSKLDPIELRQLIDDHMKYRLERVPGVAAVDVFGGLTREIQVRLDPSKVLALHLQLDQVLAAIRDANVSLPAGEIERGQYEVTLRTPGQFASLDELRDTVVALRDGKPILLRQIGDVRDTHAKVTRIERINGVPGVRMGVRKQSNANTVEVARTASREVERLNRDFPQVQIVTLIDASEYIVRSINNIGQTILYGGALAALVLLFFLRNLRSTLVVTTAIPISLIATFTLIYFGGFTLNIMTLGGLSLGVGMMVDNSIVVLENIVRHREAEPGDPAGSAIRGTGQVAMAILASTLTTMAVFLPLFFFRGLTGVMFSQMAFVVAFALGCSLLVALSLVPMLAARLARSPADSQAAGSAAGRRMLTIAQRAFEGLERRYAALLAGALRRRAAVLLVTGLLLGGALLLIPSIGTEFMPSTDESEVRVTVEMEPGTRLELLDRQMRVVEGVISEAVPERIAYFLRTGGSFFHAAPATGEFRITLPPSSQRTRTSTAIAADLRGRLANLPGATVRTRAGTGLFVLRLGNTSDEQLQ
ncbi:MAG: efflux RND transporter permease subunit, partial [Candidatus Lambdaproteobacteria bacterium]|nr:efflux RND transporter permease subunit [Candidatus Lambdaproteobacteria bacterium]